MDLTRLNSIKDISKDQVLDKSADGKTLILVDGTRVSDKLIDRAKTEARAMDAADDAAEVAGKELLDDPDFVAKVHAIAEDAARSVFNEQARRTG